MAKYQFHISNYHAIKHANLILGGLTVVAGVNGCGKVQYLVGCTI